MGAAVVLCNKRKLLRRLASWTSLLYWPPRMTTLWVVIFLHYNILQRKWKMQHFGMWDLLILCWFGFPTLCREFGMIFSPNLWTCDAAWRTPHHLACETLTKAVMPVNASLHLHLPQYMNFSKLKWVQYEVSPSNQFHAYTLFDDRLWRVSLTLYTLNMTLHVQLQFVCFVQN